jgi:hypothetical protein
MAFEGNASIKCYWDSSPIEQIGRISRVEDTKFIFLMTEKFEFLEVIDKKQ